MSEARIHLDAQVQVRRDTEANWVAVDPVLRDGEIAYSRDINRIKIGDGAHKWSELEYMLSVDAPDYEDIDLSGYAKKEEVATLSELLASMWSFDDDGNLVTNRNVIIKKNVTIGGDTSTGGTGEDPSVSGTVTGIRVDANTILEPTNGIVDMSDVLANLDVDVDLSDYYTKQETTSEIANAVAGLNLGQYATTASLATLQTEVDNIEAVLGMDEEAAGIINTWNEVKAFLGSIEVDDDLAAILSAMNADIAKRALASDLEALALTVGDNTTNIRNLKDSIYTKDDLATYKAWWDDLMGLIVKEGSDIKIKTNLIIAGDTSSEGTGESVVSGITGIKLNGTTYKDDNNDGIIDLGTITGGLTSVSWSDVQGRPTKVSEFLNDSGFITSAALLGYATQSWVEGKGYITGIDKSMVASAVGASGNAGKVLSSTGGDLGWVSLPTTLPASDVYAWAKKSSLALADVPDLSSKYLSVNGGTISGTSEEPLTLNSNQAQIRLLIQRNNENKSTLGWHQDFGTWIYDHASGHSLGIRATNGTPFYNDGTFRTLIHSGNIGDYTIRNHGNKGAIDFNNELNNGLQYVSGSSSNGGKAYDIMLSTCISDSAWQLVGGRSGELRYRGGLGTASGWGSWKTIAFTDSNVASATQLATTRSIWGQNFNGTGDVSGSLANVLHIYMTAGYHIMMGNASVLTLDGNNLQIGQGVSGNTIIGGGNVLIGTTSDNGGKLQVSGTMTIRGGENTGINIHNTYGTFNAIHFYGVSGENFAVIHAFDNYGTQKNLLNINATGGISLGSYDSPAVLINSSGAVTMSSTLSVSGNGSFAAGLSCLDFSFSKNAYIPNIEYQKLYGIRPNTAANALIGFHGDEPILLSAGGSFRLGKFDYNSNVWCQFTFNSSSKNLTIGPADTFAFTTTIDGNLVVAGDISA